MKAPNKILSFRTVLSILLLAPPMLTAFAAHAQSSGPTVDVCSTQEYDGWSSQFDQTTCIYGDATDLIGDVQVELLDSGFIAAVGANALIYDMNISPWQGTLVATSGDQLGGSWAEATTSLTPTIGENYQLVGYYNECYDQTGSGDEYDCDWQGDGGGDSVEAQVAAQGYLNPKYKVVGIVYAVPGEQSYAQYTDTQMMGTSTSTSGSFNYDVTSANMLCGETKIFGNGVNICGTYTSDFSQEQDTSSSYAVNQSTSFVNQWNPLTGPCLDHGNDVIYVWVNPVVWYSVTKPGEPLQWNGYTYDSNDDSHNMEVIPLRLSELENPSTIDSYRMGRLQRTWAQNNVDGSSPAITDQDLLDIASLDPFSDPNYTIAYGSDGVTTADDRFMQSTNNELWYLPGDTPSYNWSYTATTTAGQGGKTTYSTEFAVEEKFKGSFFWQTVTYDLKQSAKFAWQDQWNNLTTNMSEEQAKVQIAGPPTNSGCAEEYNVFQDNVYGTFMVAPIQ